MPQVDRRGNQGDAAPLTTQGDFTMTIDEMIEALEDQRDLLGGEAEVRIMTQQNWPFENSVYGITNGQLINEYCEDGEESDDSDVEDDKIVYIVEGTQLGYGSKRAWDAC